MNTEPHYIVHPATPGVRPFRAPTTSKYPWGALQVLGWFDAPAADERSLRSLSARRNARPDGKRYRVEKRGPDTVRVWRIA